MAPASSLVAAFVVLAPLFADGRALRQERGDPRTLLVIGAHMFGKDENDADYQKWKSQTWDRTILVEANPFVYRDLAAAATTFPASFGKVEVYRLLRPVEGVAAAARPGRPRGSRRRRGRSDRGGRGGGAAATSVSRGKRTPHGGSRRYNWGVMSRAAHGFIREENKCPSFYHVNRTYPWPRRNLPSRTPVSAVAASADYSRRGRGVAATRLRGSPLRNDGSQPPKLGLSRTARGTPLARDWTDRPRRYLANHPELPHQYDQIGSFRISHVLKHIPKRLHDGDPYFVAQSKIECRLLPEILEELRPATLKLDTEGLDCDLIKAVPCRTWQLAHVSSIVFEWKHCPTVAARAIWQVVRCKFEIASFGEEDVHMTRVGG